MRIKILGLAIAAAVAAPAAAVQPVTVSSAGIYNPGNVAATVGGSSTNELATALHLTGKSVATAAFDALGFCVDLPHNIYVAIGGQLPETLAFHVAPLTTDGYGNVLSTTQVHEITGLARLGFTIAKGAPVDAPTQLAAIQQAIWTVEYPTSTFTASGPYATAQATYAAAFIAEAPRLSGFARNIVADNGSIQGQITNIGGVPEPTSWALLLVGFGTVGVLARSRRSGLVTVAA